MNMCDIAIGKVDHVVEPQCVFQGINMNSKPSGASAYNSKLRHFPIIKLTFISVIRPKIHVLLQSVKIIVLKNYVMECRRHWNKPVGVQQ